MLNTLVYLQSPCQPEAMPDSIIKIDVEIIFETSDMLVSTLAIFEMPVNNKTCENRGDSYCVMTV